MRIPMLLVALAAIPSCAVKDDNARFADMVWMAEERRKWAEFDAQEAAKRAAAENALTPQQRADREFQAAKAGREQDLLQRALTNSPDYAAAVRRAAVANVEGPPSVAPGARRPALNAKANEAAVAAEEARLSDVIEQQRREMLAAQQQRALFAQDTLAIYQCRAQGAQVGALYYNPRSFLNLESAIAETKARDDCLRAYQMSRGM